MVPKLYFYQNTLKNCEMNYPNKNLIFKEIDIKNMKSFEFQVHVCAVYV